MQKHQIGLWCFRSDALGESSVFLMLIEPFAQGNILNKPMHIFVLTFCLMLYSCFTCWK